MTHQVPLPWERLLWCSRPWHLARRAAGERYLLTDVRLVRVAGDDLDEIALDDIGDIHRTETPVGRFLNTSTLLVHSRRHARDPIVLSAIRRGPQLAALLELMAGDPRAPRDADAVRSALAWEPRAPAFHLREAIAGFLGVLIVIFGVVIGLHGTTQAELYAPDDAIAPNGERRDQADIVQFMEADVMPWARQALGPLKGGADRITCETCHGRQPAARGWRMPAVTALPQPDVKDRGWETYNRDLDAQLRNAIYGYLAESGNQTRAAYMREIVLPGMARLLHRPAYDFTKSYAYNRSRRAIGCYHCHQVK